LISEGADAIEDQSKDRILPFDEYPDCEMCGSDSLRERLVTQDGSHISECNNCGLWFTTPRINEQSWVNYLKTPSERNEEFTENRLKYGVALSANVKYVFPGWRNNEAEAHNNILDKLEKYSESGIKKLHDVGCGVGFFLQDAMKRGIEASGNELNEYAYRVMTERLGMKIYNDMLPDLDIPAKSLDAITMRDYIEHTYHPLADLQAANSYLKTNGLLYVETFHIDCEKYDRLGKNWNMLFWNHVYHFSTRTLTDIIKLAGFDILDIDGGYHDVNVKIVARKSS
jgi:SAM-dependent methyltransferase